MVKLSPTLISILLTLPFALQAQLTYDGFSSGTYPAGQTINNLTGGEGWDDSWSVNASNANNPLRYQGSTVSLGYTDSVGNNLATTPGSLELLAGGSGAGELSRNLASSLSGEVWMGFLNIRTSSGNWNWQIQLANAAGSVQANIQNASSSGQFRLQAGGQTSSNLTLDNFDTSWSPGDNAQLYLLQLTNVGSGTNNATATLWANPLNIENLAAGAESSVALTGIQLDTLDQFIFNKGSGLDQTGYFDELRIGTSSADILAIPEPRVYALLAGIFSLAIVVMRRRQKG